MNGVSDVNDDATGTGVAVNDVSVRTGPAVHDVSDADVRTRPCTSEETSSEPNLEFTRIDYHRLLCGARIGRFL